MGLDKKEKKLGTLIAFFENQPFCSIKALPLSSICGGISTLPGGCKVVKYEKNEISFLKHVKFSIIFFI